MEKKDKKKDFVEPELIKHEEKLDEVTMGGVCGSVINDVP
jgi:hypothetical protein